MLRTVDKSRKIFAAPPVTKSWIRTWAGGTYTRLCTPLTRHRLIFLIFKQFFFGGGGMGGLALKGCSPLLVCEILDHSTTEIWANLRNFSVYCPRDNVKKLELTSVSLVPVSVVSLLVLAKFSLNHNVFSVYGSIYEEAFSALLILTNIIWNFLELGRSSYCYVMRQMTRRTLNRRSTARLIFRFHEYKWYWRTCGFGVRLCDSVL